MYHKMSRVITVVTIVWWIIFSGIKLGGDKGKIVALGAEILP